MPRTAASAVSWLSKSPRWNSTAPVLMCGWMFSIRPLLRLSTTRTRAPLATRASTRCDPMKDAPPVTRVLVADQFIDCSFDRLLGLFGSVGSDGSCDCRPLPGRGFGHDVAAEHEHVHPGAEKTVERFGRLM